MIKKYNQVRNRRIKDSGNNDEQENIDIANLLRSIPNIIVKREWFILFTLQCEVIRVQEKEPTKDELTMIAPNLKYRHPDFMVFEKIIDENNNAKRGKLLCCMENDGNIHRIKYADTVDRNLQYEQMGVPLLVINKERVAVSVYDEAYNKLQEFLNEQQT